MSTSKFVAAMDAQRDLNPANKILGENGAPEYDLAGAGDPRVALFFKLVRSLNDGSLDFLMDNALRQFDESGDTALVVDLFVLAFQTRATRGDGKGEKRLFVQLLLRLHRRFPETVVKVLDLIPHYGYFKDYLLIVEAISAHDDADARARMATLERAALGAFSRALDADTAALKEAEEAGTVPTLSLAAKWAPREGRHFNEAARALAAVMFPEVKPETARCLYRKRVAALNRALNTPEVMMSAHRYADLDFGKVPAGCLARNRLAFLNEKGKRKLPAHLEETGNRFPEDEDRVKARRKLREAVKEKLGVKGAQLHPHELVAKLLKQRVYHHRDDGLSTAELDVINAQWDALRESVRQQLTAATAARDLDVLEGDGAPAAEAEAKVEAHVTRGSRPVTLGNLTALVDVSGSMHGQPMEVAIALGILVAELAAPSFKDRLLTFESQPQWVDLTGAHTLETKVERAARAPWGGSTNFAEALERILEVAEMGKLKPDDVPDLIVFSDMQFDVANGSIRGKWETHFERIERRFAEVGCRICGEPYPAPRIIFWNLRGNTQGFVAQSDAPNVQMLSGFSPSLLKLVLEGEDLMRDEVELVQADGTIKVVREGPTPYETLRKALDNAAFDKVRLAVAEVGEGPLAGYVFETAEGFEAL